VPGFVIQGGDPKGDGTGGPGYTIKDEPVVGTYGRGTEAMARSSAPDSQGSQSFIVLDDAAHDALDLYRTYDIIGTVTDGMGVVDAIAAMPNSGDASAVPQRHACCGARRRWPRHRSSRPPASARSSTGSR
jgi:peptidyl-prolyl cis-trans isomerase B (cyclophilin B)